MTVPRPILRVKKWVTVQFLEIPTPFQSIMELFHLLAYEIFL